MKDILGREIEVGDRVAYAIRNSHVAELVLATVLEVQVACALVRRDEALHPWQTEARPGYIRFEERVIVYAKKEAA